MSILARMVTPDSRFEEAGKANLWLRVLDSKCPGSYFYSEVLAVVLVS